MNREIKFRVYDKTGGYYIAILDNDCFSIKQVARVILELEVLKHEYIIEQYTGLKDKNGKEICEGDIVRYNIWLRGSAKNLSCTTVVELWSGEEEEYPYCTTSGFSLPHGEDGYEVIGDIHENPELLEAKNVD